MLYVHVVLNSMIFPQILHDVVPVVKIFPKYYFNKLFFQLPQKVTWNDE